MGKQNMTVRQKQHLLGYLGYYLGAVDGIWGEKSRKAAEKFQRAYGLEPDDQLEETSQKRLLEVIAKGIVPEDTKDFWQEITWFSREEFRCSCGGRGCGGFPVEPAERLARNAQMVRQYFGKPVCVSSGVRCALRNAELPGSAENSIHMRGKAMDFTVRGIAAERVLAYVRTLPEVHEAYAIDGSYVHMGVQKY